MDTARLEHRYLRSALEFAVLMVAEGRKRRPPLPYPTRMKKYLSMQRLPTAALGPLRRIVDDDAVFRERIALAAVPELVDPIGILWLQRPQGWETEVAALVAAAEQAELEAEREQGAARERKKRVAAEQAAARSRAAIVALEARVVELTTLVDDLRAEVHKLEDVNAETRAELIDTRNEARHANDRAAAAVRKLETLRGEHAAALARVADAERARDGVLADRVTSGIDAAQLAELAGSALDLAERLQAVSDGSGDRRPGRQRPTTRRALAVPGGVVGDSEAATKFFLRSGASILIDGYNVSMLGWTSFDLPAQRRLLLECSENLARRYGADLTVVFDGSDVVGAVADQRRVVRVVFSPAGVIADDVIRAEVARLPISRPVVVVTNDAVIVRDVRSMGANTVSSDQFLALAKC